MLSLPASIRIFVYTGVTDMRRSFDRLAQMVEEHLEQDPESGHLYLFFNRSRDCVKMLLWEGDGFVIWYKRLEAGTFAVPTPRASRSDAVQIRARDLNLLLAGVDPTQVTRRKWPATEKKSQRIRESLDERRTQETQKDVEARREAS